MSHSAHLFSNPYPVLSHHNAIQPPSTWATCGAWLIIAYSSDRDVATPTLPPRLGLETLGSTWYGGTYCDPHRLVSLFY